MPVMVKAGVSGLPARLGHYAAGTRTDGDLVVLADTALTADNGARRT